MCLNFLSTILTFAASSEPTFFFCPNRGLIRTKNIYIKVLLTSTAYKNQQRSVRTFSITWHKCKISAFGSIWHFRTTFLPLVAELATRALHDEAPFMLATDYLFSRTFHQLHSFPTHTLSDKFFYSIWETHYVIILLATGKICLSQADLKRQYLFAADSVKPDEPDTPVHVGTPLFALRHNWRDRFSAFTACSATRFASVSISA